MDEKDNDKFTEVVQWLEREYSGIRTGQAAPALLDGIKAEAYGSLMPLIQVASIGIEDARTLRVSPWDAGIASAVEKAITNADLGVSVVSDSSGLRVVFPELTSERREQLIKLAKKKLEDARVSVRSVRDDLMKRVDKEQKSGEMSEDELQIQKKKIQEQVDSTNKKLEDSFIQKEKEVTK